MISLPDHVSISGLCPPLLAAALLVGSVPAAAQTPESPVRDSRLMPPAYVACERDELTSYSGEVTDYTREPGVTSITIHTDWNTSETVVVEHPGSNNPSARFLVNGRLFTADDWALIEVGHGMIREGARVTAWVCSDGATPPLVDWHPGGDPR